MSASPWTLAPLPVRVSPTGKARRAQLHAPQVHPNAIASVSHKSPRFVAVLSRDSINTEGQTSEGKTARLKGAPNAKYA